MNKIKNLVKYISIFFITLSILFMSLILTAKIPKKMIVKNIQKSVSFFKYNAGIEELQKRRDYTYLFFYPDSLLLNMIYCIDTNKPVKSVMEAKYYETIKADVHKDFIELVKKDKEPNEQYLRYWHGSMIVLRPLLTILNIEQIYKLNEKLMMILAISLIILLFNKSKKLAIIFFISLILIAFPIVTMCWEYVPTFYIMLIVSIISLLIEKKGNSKLYSLFLITGMLTCFFDFLTTEIITIFVPLLLILIIRKEENRLNSFKEGLIFIIKCSILWFIGYAGMYLSKWLLASIILKINALEYVKDNAMARINGLQGIESYKVLYTGAIERNIRALYPINIIKRDSTVRNIAIVIGIFIIAITDWKNIKKQWFSILMLLIGFMPYVRYLIMANHSYGHYFFTFRIQIITIIAVLYIISEINYIKTREILKKMKVKLKGKYNNYVTKQENR